MLKGSIKVSGFDKRRLIPGKNGALYLSFVIYENDEPDMYGNTHVIKEDTSKEERESGVKARIIGNAKDFGQKRAPSPAPAQRRAFAPDPDLDSSGKSDVPF